jgi:transcriptional regulator with XRE-family HTH domain
MATVSGQPRHYLRAWRRKAGLTLEQVAAQVEGLSRDLAKLDPNLRPMSMTHATLSRIERGKLPYAQALLEILAEIYRTDLASLLMRDPADPEGLWALWDQLEPQEQAQAVAALKAIKGDRAG